MHTYEHRQFMVFSVSELSNINFNEVLETSADTVRKNVDGTKTFVKWDSETIPPSVDSLTTKEGPYTYEQMLELLATAEWSNPNSEMSM